MSAPDSRTATSAPAPLDAPHHAPPATSAWSSVYFDAQHVDKLVDRLTMALSEKTELVRELETARSALAAQQQQLLDARDKAERARATLSTFLHALGHDLRAPLVSLDASLQLLEIESTARMALGRESACPTTLSDHLTSHATERAVQLAAQDMRRTCGHGLALIHDLFELIRSDAGAWRVELAEVTLGELFSSAVAVIAAQAHAKGLAIELRWNDPALSHPASSHAPLAHTTVVTDRTRVTQALVNLVGNAVKFTPSGTITIGIALRACGRAPQPNATMLEGTILEVTVDDTGPGIEDAILPRIFEPFAQGEAGLRSKGGVGLGLAIVERCALLLGGTVRAANRPTGGARFTLSVPVSCSRPCTSQTTPTAALVIASAEINEQTTVQPLRVLVVDDAPDAARLLEHHLRHASATVTHAASLSEARELLDASHCASSSFDLVITDLELGDGSGLDLANELTCRHEGELRPLAQRPSVVVSSARPASEVSQVWCGTFLPKPVTRAAIDAILHESRRTHRASSAGSTAPT